MIKWPNGDINRDELFCCCVYDKRGSEDSKPTFNEKEENLLTAREQSFISCMFLCQQKKYGMMNGSVIGGADKSKRKKC